MLIGTGSRQVQITSIPYDTKELPKRIQNPALDTILEPGLGKSEHCVDI
jgi:hypothetical protein